MCNEEYGYLIEGKSKNGMALFNKQQDYEQYLRLMWKYKKRFKVQVYAYCLLPESVHLLINPLVPKVISDFMKGIHQMYARYFNETYERRGSVWKDCCHYVAMYDNKDLVSCVRLIERLPVEHGLALLSEGYPYSSCGYRVMGKGLLDKGIAH